MAVLSKQVPWHEYVTDKVLPIQLLPCNMKNCRDALVATRFDTYNSHCMPSLLIPVYFNVFILVISCCGYVSHLDAQYQFS